MLDKKEKLIMAYLSKICVKKKTYLVSPSDLNAFCSRKYILSVAEIDEIMVSLSNSSYIDFVVSDSKKGYFYCVSLKNKGFSFLSDIKKEKKQFYVLIARTLFLTILSFGLGMLLKAIFKG